ncbi:MAG: toll/interleukin-1 receptor domain-containing protein [Candidatus Hodarchaeota archaeon]
MSVFISYSHIDRERAQKLCRALERLGVEMFIDEKDIHWGKSVSETIRDALRACSAILVIVSPDSLKSTWVPYEIGQATALGKTILPYLTDPNLRLPGYLQSLNYKTDVNEVIQYFDSKSSQKAVRNHRTEKPYRILIAGSSRYDGSDRTIDLFHQTCQEVGRRLADLGLHLVIGSYAPDTADMAVLKSFGNNGGRQVIIAGISERPVSWWRDELEGFDFEKISFVQDSGSWDYIGRPIQIDASDAVFIIGGAKGAINLSKLCVEKEHPIVATPQLGRAAKSIWDKRVRQKALVVSPNCVRMLESGNPSEVAVAGLDLLSMIALKK